MLKRELESVRRELRILKTGQHEIKRENVEGDMTADERIIHERTGHATYDPSQSARSVNASTKGSCGSCIVLYNSQEHSTRCRSQDPGWCWTAWRNVCESGTSKGSKNSNDKLLKQHFNKCTTSKSMSSLEMPTWQHTSTTNVRSTKICTILQLPSIFILVIILLS